MISQTTWIDRAVYTYLVGMREPHLDIYIYREREREREWRSSFPHSITRTVQVGPLLLLPTVVSPIPRPSMVGSKSLRRYLLPALRSRITRHRRLLARCSWCYIGICCGGTYIHTTPWCYLSSLRYARTGSWSPLTFKTQALFEVTMHLTYVQSS